MYPLLLIAGTLLLSAGSARAEHSHTVGHGGDNAFGAGVSMVAASFDTMLYTGNYQGIVPAVSWAGGRFAAGANASLYRVIENGASYYGLGDVVVNGQVTVVGDHHAQAGVVAAVSAPVGDHVHGLGMGHPMVMPALFGSWMYERIALSATAGYSRAIVGDTNGHDHGMWPIVDPMNLSEITWSTAGEVAITPQIRGGARFAGGIPIGNGDHRIVGAVRVGWGTRRFATAAELQAGIVGDPFNIRGVVSTTWKLLMRCLWLIAVVAACGSSPEPTGTVCPEPDPMTLTYDNFGREFMDKYCTWCHASELPRSQRNGAPLYHDFDSLLGVLQTPDHIDEQTGFGPSAKNEFMPPERCPTTAGGALDRDCPQPTADERTKLAQWIACERNRSHNFIDAGVDAP